MKSCKRDVIGGCIALGVLTLLAAVGAVVVVRELVRLTMPVWVFIDSVGR